MCQEKKTCVARSVWLNICFRMLDEFGAEIEHADSRLDATMKKMAKVLHLSDGKCDRHCNLNIFITTNSWMSSQIITNLLK